MRKLISLEDAVAITTDHILTVGKEEVSLSSTLGRVISENIFASISIPPFNRSPLDGYAVRAEDIAKASTGKPVELKVSMEIPAGKFSEIELGRNQAVKILTGAPIPPGADVVIRLEDVKITGQRIEVFNPLPAFTNYCFAGEDIQQEEMALTAGTVIDPAAIAVLAGLGISVVTVYRVPQIAIISTGDELVDIDEKLLPGKIYNSNLYTLTADLQRTGAKPVPKGIAADRPRIIAHKIDEALQSSDMVITTGGVSVGDYDAVKDSLALIGAEILFHGVDMRPGTPTVCAVKNGKIIFGLSGNPAAAFNSYHLIAKPAVFKLMGISKWQLSSTTAVLEDNYPKISKQRRFLRGQVYLDKGILKVRLTGKQNPGIIKSMLNCNVLVDIPAGSPGLKAGSKVEAVLL